MAMYAIVTSSRTLDIWPRAVKGLRSKYEEKWPGKVHLICYDPAASGGVRNAISLLRNHSPSFTCFLEHHSLCSKQFVRDVNQLTRDLDPTTPYGDTVWGILTGYVEEDVLFAVRQSPLVIKRATGNSPMWVKTFPSGLWFSEGEKGVAIRKLPTEDSERREKCPDDATAVFVRELSAVRDLDNDEGVDFIGTSGHASEGNLKMGYNFNSGALVSKKGHLYGHSLNGSKVTVERNECPKVLSAAGNCLIGHILDEDSMALGWMHSACVVQMTGYIEGTWFGYGGWGVNHYLCEEPGGMTFSEAFFANQQALLHTLQSKYGSTGGPPQDMGGEHDGLLHDRDSVAFYGDPAWEASLEKGSPQANYSHTVTQRTCSSPSGDGWLEWEYQLTTLKSGKWSRPPVYVFPARVQRVRLVSGSGVLTCRFLLLPLTGSYGAREQHTVVFQTHQ